MVASTTEYTTVTVICTGMGSDTMTISYSLNGKSINSATLIESNNSPFTVTSSGTFTTTYLSNTGQYKCTVSLVTDGICHSSTTDFDVS